MKTHLLQQDSLRATWRALAVRRDLADAAVELSPDGDIMVRDEDPWHQIFSTDVFCRLAIQLARTRTNAVARTRAFLQTIFQAHAAYGRSIAGASARCAHRCRTVTHRGPS
ncbi:MAG: Restriction endonuclease [Caballeronia mineralivorans]|nr:Restriction endonuclease [Caballeronia mineralivorans]